MKREKLRLGGAALVCLAALACLPACTGAGGAGETGGAGGSGGETGEGCEPACGEYEVCDAGECSATFEVALDAVEGTVVQPDGATSVAASVQACERKLGPTDSSGVLAQEGSCRVVQSASLSSSVPATFGAIVASAPSFGSVELDLLSANVNCAATQLDAMPAGYLEGETVNFAVGAGTHNPAFELGVSSPPSLSFAPGPFTKGQPYAVSWETNGPPPRIMVITTDGDAVIVCNPTEGASLTIPAALTSLINSAEPVVVVNAFARSEPTSLAVTPAYTATIAAGRSHLVAVPYAAP